MGVWIETFFIWLRLTVMRVTPFVGVWIETQRRMAVVDGPICHTLRGCVD